MKKNIPQIDSEDSLTAHYQLIRKKKILHKVYEHFYSMIAHEVEHKKILVELGSGGGFIKEIIPQVITSDVLAGKEIDKVFSAEKMPFKNNSVDAFIMLNVFHHIKKPAKALEEMQRCLKKGGNIVMIEPWNSVWGKFVYQHFHHEQFNPNASWMIPGKGRMSHANGALPWIIFERDKKLLEKRIPSLKIEKIHCNTPLLYLLSGGLSKIQLWPTSSTSLLFKLDHFLETLSPHLGMFATIITKKM